MTSFNFATAQLSRYPVKHSKDLQAWDAADEYLSRFITSDSNVLILNDGFGAIDCAVRAARATPLHLNDSWCSLRAIELNTLQTPALFKAQAIDRGLVKLPKSISMLESQLTYVSNQLQQPLEIYFSGMQKHVSSGHLDLLKQICTRLEYLPTERKARMYKGVLQPCAHQTQITNLAVPELGLTLQNAAGVFAEQKLDIGSRFFIEHFHLLPSAQKVADVGCGNGLLSLAYHRLHPPAELMLFDESFAATESARLSFALNFPGAHYHIQHNDGLSGVEQIFDLIMINPPFHQQNTVTTDIANSMFQQAKQCMAASSELWIVANRHLNYPLSLKRGFRSVSVMAENAKFVIIRAKL
ncbi:MULTISPECIES: class I SAM-dependent methyltransferase [Deefgea]|uniref:Methyltransferase n=1 Tax=Deefgea chitinilytica TaxID=570276 RepID=A0ABS2C991_9NEIS|nr:MULTISPECIES: methyltransferase [Deefgea]MBM5570718.1 methyltransferase [Deefgea chitinilytica]MBM9887947.1 methyltransferase [Deefgea sp. CFH1-16]